MKRIGIVAGAVLVLTACNEQPAMNVLNSDEAKELPAIEETTTSTKKDAEYWYSGKAEITSFKLNQARYGELREGTAVMVFVTEPFSPSSNTKADTPKDDNVSVLKLNQTRNFTTGIYPYSIMTSSFFPFKKGDYSLKLSSSSQEWCGQTYMELRKKRANFEVDVDSYFEGESYEKQSTDVSYLEEDIWSMIRIRNKDLPLGTHSVYPSMMFTRLLHVEYRPYQCNLSRDNGGETHWYTMEFPELDRTIKIEYEAKHPYKIIGWEEIYFSGYGNKRKKLKTTATRMKTINSDYWNKNSLADDHLRKELNL